MKAIPLLTVLSVAGLAGCLSPTMVDSNASPGEATVAPSAVQLPAGYDPRASLAPLVDILSPAVVFIEVEKKEEVSSQLPPGMERWAPFFGIPTPDSDSDSEPQYRTRRGSGSGFIISTDGYVLTNNHVVDGADKVTITMDDDSKLEATVVGTDPRTDVALVKIDADVDLPTVALGDSDGLRVGDWVMAIGNPFGLTHTVTAGIVSAKGRVIGAGPYDDFIQTDASINPGNSGGPLFNLKGEVVGINTAIVPMGQGIGFAVPIDQVEAIIDDLKTEGRVARGWIGVGLQELSDPLKKQLAAESGVVVSAVYPGNPAAEAGLRAGDVIVGVDGEKVTESEQVIRAIGARKPGDSVKLGVLRDGSDKTIKVTLGERPDEDRLASRSFRGDEQKKPDAGEDSPLHTYGFRIEKRSDLSVKGGEGIVVSAVIGGTPADGRLQIGDVITQVNRKSVRSIQDVEKALAADPEGALLVVQRDGAETLVMLQKE